MDPHNIHTLQNDDTPLLCVLCGGESHFVRTLVFCPKQITTRPSSVRKVYRCSFGEIKERMFCGSMPPGFWQTHLRKSSAGWPQKPRSDLSGPGFCGQDPKLFCVPASISSGMELYNIAV
jgi:hypothetical protein